VAKNDNTNATGKSDGVKRISSLDNPSEDRGSRLFIAGIVLVVVGGIAAVAVLAAGRESNLGVDPDAGDHWHSAYLIHQCGVDLPATSEFETTIGLHTHGDGLLHIHPFSPAGSGRNATLGEYFEEYGATLTDETFETGPFDLFPATLSEEEGCDGEPAELQLAVWENAFDETAEPVIITEDLADFRFDTAGEAITLALVAEGAEVPRPPQERIDQLLATGPGGPIEGVAEGESPVVTVPGADVGDVETDPSSDDADADGDADVDEVGSGDADADATSDDADGDGTTGDADATTTDADSSGSDSDS
jgi:hypothetical protein